ncbi:hypothetical protein BAC3_02193 [uncultured bacterium]|nr:hypothetical protein BAC3_02193 [uncultured bacterium]
MFENIVPITHEQHKNKKIRPISNFDFAKQFNIASIMVHEFSRAASTYPIVFLEDKDRDEFRPVVLMGLETGENLFIRDGRWDASYIPAIIRRYPFALAKTSEQGDNYTVCLDNSSELINETEGEPLFNNDGTPSEMMERVKRYLAELQQMDKFTQEFCQFLQEHNMFTPLNMKVRQQDEIKNITGCYVVNEERLNNMSDEGFLAFRKKQFLPAMYAHLISLAQIERLLKYKEQATGVPTEQFPVSTELH